MTEEEPSIAGTRVVRSSLSVLSIRGGDRRDYLHRMATNDIESLEKGRGTPVLFLERTGRLIDRLIVADRGDDFLCVGNRDRAGASVDWLRKYTIAEDVEAEDLTPSTGVITVLGDGAPEVLAARLGVPAADLAPWEHREADGVRAAVLRAEDVGGRSFHVVAPADARDEVAGALSELEEGSEEEYRALRIRAGVPGWGEEFTERTIPLETRMADAISFTKGCFLGQEVIARLHNYRRVKRALVRLRIEGGSAPVRGARLVDGENQVGEITSAAAFDDAVFALAYVQAGRETPGARFRVEEAGSSRDAEVLTLTPAGEPS